MKRWSKHRDACLICWKADQPHYAHGLCRRCYFLWRTAMDPVRRQQSKKQSRLRTTAEQLARAQERDRAWRAANLDRCREYHRRNKAVTLAWRRANRERVHEYYRRSRAKAKERQHG